MVSVRPRIWISLCRHDANAHGKEGLAAFLLVMILTCARGPLPEFPQEESGLPQGGSMAVKSEVRGVRDKKHLATVGFREPSPS